LAPTITTRAIDRLDRGMHFKPRLFIGQIAAAAGSAALLLSLWLGGYAVIEIGLALLGISIGYITPAMTTGVLAASPAETSGVASGILNAGRQVGSSLGVALMGTFMQTFGERGSLVSFGLMLLLFAGMGAIIARKIPGPSAS
jgi:DHA2 family methylenomycin A resistance protein-like MFS transporter